MEIYASCIFEFIEILEGAAVADDMWLLQAMHDMMTALRAEGVQCWDAAVTLLDSGEY